MLLVGALLLKRSRYMQIQELEGKVVHLKEVNQVLLRYLATVKKNFCKATGENARLKWLNSRIKHFAHLSFWPLFISTTFHFDHLSPLHILTTFHFDQFLFRPLFILITFHFYHFSFWPHFILTTCHHFTYWLLLSLTTFIFEPISLWPLVTNIDFHHF